LKGLDALVIAAGSPKPKGAKPPMGGDDGGARAFAAFRRAMDGGDDAAGYAAFKRLHDLCASAAGEPEMDEGEEPEA
jgi:hypothetical protein